MILKILGILDILAAVSVWLFGFFHILPQTFLLIIALYLLVKGVVFLISMDIASILDIICAGIIFLALSFNMPKAVILIVTLFLLQKGVLSLIS